VRERQSFAYHRIRLLHSVRNDKKVTGHYHAVIASASAAISKEDSCGMTQTKNRKILPCHSVRILAGDFKRLLHFVRNDKKVTGHYHAVIASASAAISKEDPCGMTI
jgi:hypothetical protein